MTTFAAVFPGAPESVGAARRWLSGALGCTPETEVPEDVRDAAALLVSECATNAIQHTHSGDAGQTFALSVRVDPRRVRVEITNQRPRCVLSAPRVAEAEPGAERGRGLALVRAFATQWGPLPLTHGVFYVLTWPFDGQAGAGAPLSAASAVAE